jgi:hypothetical protein
MMRTARISLIVSAAFLLCVLPVHSQTPQANSATPSSGTDGMSGMDMSHMDHGDADAAASKGADNAMSDMHMDMGPHMHMTELRPTNAGDEARAEQLVATLRQSIEKYRDYHAALADGFKIFLPNIPQPQYHFTNYANGLKAQFVFDPTRPTSLLYKKTADGYELVGAMYTAPRSFTEDQLNERVPLSVARWHEHVDFCTPPRGTPMKDADWTKFGLRGSIATQEACEQAGGVWHPIVFNWMVHVYPFETDPSKIFAH